MSEIDNAIALQRQIAEYTEINQQVRRSVLRIFIEAERAIGGLTILDAEAIEGGSLAAMAAQHAIFRQISATTESGTVTMDSLAANMAQISADLYALDEAAGGALFGIYSPTQEAA